MQKGLFLIINYIEEIHKIIDYINNNTDRQISVKELADIAGFSQYHFHRIFSAYIGEPLSTFIKRLRLEKSAKLLVYTNTNITDIALSYGYETPSAYTKAFKQLFGINPSQYKNENNFIFEFKKNKDYFEQLRRINMKNFIGIKEIEDLKIISVRKIGKYSESAGEAWSTLCRFAYSNSIGKTDKVLSPESKFIGISYDNPDITSEKNLRYDACITVDKDIKTEGEVFNSVIKGGKYAVFMHKGPYENFTATYTAIFAEWLPNSNYKLRDVPSFELYLNRDPRRTKPENLKTEIYIPIE